MTARFYQGDEYTCNCCEKSFKQFKAKGNTLVTRANAQCPFCGSLERTRTLLFYLRNETSLFTEPARLLHFAPESSLSPFFKKADNIDYVTADLNPNYADYRVDIMNIPFCDESFDYIICSHVLGHVPDEKQAIRELYRVLKPSGTALIATILDRKNPHTFETGDADTPEKRLQYYSEPDLLRLRGNDFSKRLEEGGFQVEIIDYAVQLGDDKRKKYSLGDGSRELIFKCKKAESEESCISETLD
jgi:SAM-dependent methyltransferase